MNSFFRTAVLAAATLAVATPAVAAPVAANPPARGRALILIPLTLTKLEDLSFGTIVPGNLGGTVTISPTGAAPIVAGGVTLMPSDMGAPARFAGAGTPGQLVVIDAQSPGTLSDGLGNTVTVLGVTIDGSVIRTIDSTAAFFFKVGGTVMVAANQPEGIYEADLPVTVTYF